ncbi:hypothetical protein [Nocardioides humi]|uniref:hypothetical protein n=1 Tax=Nocardioides humi TaxID=449461 RepID=UPI00112691D0|nr:hypothetical protein [Nocardioides humi]
MVEGVVEDVGEDAVGDAAGAGSVPTSYEQFGVNWIHRVLHKERILRTVDEVLGDQIALGPIGAGPGRAFASVSFVGPTGPPRGSWSPGSC